MRIRNIAIRAAALITILLAPLPAVAQATLEADGAAALGVSLRQLGTTKRVLMIGAHPDDENTAVLAELALGHGADVAYLSLTRGEGGQNLIGPELQEGLGLIRTEELLAARRLDGAQQFFTRAYDYGFSKSADEAFTQWPRDSLLSDVVEVVRRFRPDIIISIFDGTPADGHGQHQAAGILARDAFRAAADPTRFPEHAARGYAPHTVQHLFQALYRPPAQPPLTLEVGALDPLFGRSRFQIAMQSRSRHRSQDMGMAEPHGPQSVALRVLDTRATSAPTSLFAGVDTTLSQHARTAGAPASVIEGFERYERDVAQLRSTFNPLLRGRLTTSLAQTVNALNSAALALTDARFDALRQAVRDETEQLQTALQQDAGIVVDVTADTHAPVPGSTFQLTTTVWNGGISPATVSVRPVLPAGWRAEPVDPVRHTAPDATATGAEVLPDSVYSHTWRVTVPADAARREPYFLRNPRDAAMYSWRGASDSARALPFEPARIAAAARLSVGAPVTVVQAAEYVTVDKALGEVRRPVAVVPAASVTVEPRVVAIPAGNTAARTITVTVRAAQDALNGTLSLDVPAGWSATPTSVSVDVPRAGESRSVAFSVTPSPDATGRHAVRATFTSSGRAYTDGFTLVDYPHIGPHHLYRPAEVAVSVFPVRVADGLRVGYIHGAGDDGAHVLAQLGVTVEDLDAAALANADLSRYDAIVAGIRAYEVRPDLIAHNQRLIEYARAGGTFIVQYNKYEIVDGNFMPYSATMSRPHDRVTDETARVAILDPQHPLMSFPNRITAADFEGWVQERGLYHLATWDDRYSPLLSMADPGEPEQQGALFVARVGDGWYVYTGLALFRQWPEAVPGAFRLLANFVSLGKS